MKLPKVSEVLWIFAAYFVLALPVTFFVLRRFARPELAWFTTPLMSVAFAYVFYLFSASLYKSQLTQRTAGVLTAAVGDPDAHFSGCSELFIPHGGNYNIAITNAERLEVSSTEFDEEGSRNSAHDLETTDTATGVAANNYVAGNLAFRRFFFERPVQLSGVITAKVMRSTRSLTGAVTNGTDYQLNNVFLADVSNGSQIYLGALNPGETKTIAQSGNPATVPQSYTPQSILGQSFANSGTSDFNSGYAYLTATLPASSFGPSLGTDVSGPASAALVMAVPVTPRGGGT